MPQTLIERFNYGTGNWPSTFSPQGVLVYGLPKKLDELRLVVHRQIERQNNLSAQIANS
jgi:hypothetical protein